MKKLAVLKNTLSDEVLYEGDASVESAGKQSFKVLIPDAGHPEEIWTIAPDALILESRRGGRIRMVLRRNKPCKALIDVDGMHMDVDVRLLSFQANPDANEWSVRYLIPDADEEFGFSLALSDHKQADSPPHA